MVKNKLNFKSTHVIYIIMSNELNFRFKIKKSTQFYISL